MVTDIVVFSTEVVFCKVDVDENPDTAAKYSVSAMPTFVFISKGVVVDRLMGVSDAVVAKKQWWKKRIIISPLLLLFFFTLVSTGKPSKATRTN
jgi:Thioredoxin